jgi:hypothetical protein
VGTVRAWPAGQERMPILVSDMNVSVHRMCEDRIEVEANQANQRSGYLFALSLAYLEGFKLLINLIKDCLLLLCSRRAESIAPC